MGLFAALRGVRKVEQPKAPDPVSYTLAPEERAKAFLQDLNAIREKYGCDIIPSMTFVGDQVRPDILIQPRP